MRDELKKNIIWRAGEVCPLLCLGRFYDFVKNKKIPDEHCLQI
jgi:hypothetical protein